MALNTTITSININIIPQGETNIPGISSQCWNWCREQHLTNQSNLTIEGISIIAIALIVLFIYNLSIKYWENLPIAGEAGFVFGEGIDKTKVKKYIDLLPELVIYLLIGFFVWFVWFS